MINRSPPSAAPKADHDRDRPVLKAFLSHRYGSPAINLYFYDIFSQIAEVQFEVDEGGSPISMVRLARMVRDADAFIGIYPFPAAPETRVARKDLEVASRYFRLELSLAVRAAIPTIAFVDERYRAVLDVPESVYRRSFDVQEITNTGGTPSENQHLQEFDDFCRSVTARMAYQVEANKRVQRSAVGLLLPPGPHGYDDSLVQDLAKKVDSRGHRAVALPWPLSINLSSMRVISGLDWLIFDPGDGVDGAAALGWLDGQGIPFARLRRLLEGSLQVPDAEVALYHDFEVGYNEDRLVWTNRNDLLDSVDELIDIIVAPVKRINTQEDAKHYFESAEQRSEKVFLSYASENDNIASQLAQELKRKFKVVFDYRDGKSMYAGSGYPKQLYGRLEESDIGIPVLSEPYMKKGTCTHEAEDMCASYDSKRMFVYPISVDECKPPPYFRSVQFEAVNRGDFDAELVVERVIKGYENWRKEVS